MVGAGLLIYLVVVHNVGYDERVRVYAYGEPMGSIEECKRKADRLLRSSPPRSRAECWVSFDGENVPPVALPSTVFRVVKPTRRGDAE